MIGNVPRRVKVPAAPGNRFVGLVLLFSTHNGEPLAIFPDGVVQHMRVGATNGLGIKYMAREDARTVGILGSGWQAETQLSAACAVRPIESIRCFSPNRERREAFAAHMTEVLHVPVTPVEQPEDAVRGVDIAMCATNSIGSVLFKDAVGPGMHLSSIKPSEIEPAAIRTADRVVVHTHDTQPLVVVSADANYNEGGKGLGWDSARELGIANCATLPDLIAGRARGRETEEEVNCFLNNLGLGFQFAAAGSVIYQKAREQGVGHDLPTDWFSQTVHS
jgi:ornithine cyclodeaminase/alanine dehydrogenase-like protein (mu-crystallin family)